MSTKSFPAASVREDVGTPPAVVQGVMNVTMLVTKYYIDGSRLQAGNTYPVLIDWAQRAIDSAWATEASAASGISPQVPSLPAPQGLSGAQQAMLGVGPYFSPARVQAGVRYIAALETGATSRAGYSTVQVFAVPEAFDAVKIVWQNNAPTAATVTLKAVVSGTDTFYKTGSTTIPAVRPTLSGSPVLPVNVTVAGNPSIILPAGTTNNPSETSSDWIPISSPDRADGKTGGILWVGHALDGANGNCEASKVLTNSFRDFNSIDNRFALLAGEQAAFDVVVNPATFNPVTQNGFMLPVYYPVFRFRKSVRSLLISGDSTFDLSQLTGIVPYTSFVERLAVAAQAIGFPLMPINYGWAGQTTAQYSVNGFAGLASSVPTIGMLLPYSWNNSGGGTVMTTAQLNTALQLIAQWTAACQAQNTTPAFLVPWPQSFNAGDTNMAALRNYMRTTVANSRTLVFDADLLFGQGPVDNRTFQDQYWNSAYDITAAPGKRVHPNELAVQTLTNAMVAKFATL